MHRHNIISDPCDQRFDVSVCGGGGGGGGSAISEIRFLLHRDAEIRFCSEFFEVIFDVLETSWARKKATTGLFIQSKIFLY